MDFYDVIIVGGGPAGLKCAHTLIGTDMRVLLLEKETIFGDKLCAGGLTMNDIKLLSLPDHVIEHKIQDTALHSPKRKSTTKAPNPFLFTVDRKNMGNWQKELLKNTNITVITESQLVSIEHNKVFLKNGECYGFSYLVGADGYSSKVRKHLGIPVNKKLIGIQYTLPITQPFPQLEIHLDAELFHSWYAWVFPHNNCLAIGCCSDPHVIAPAKLARQFHEWLNKRGIQYRGNKLSSCPINYDFQGVKFGNIYLIGEAAGMASGLTGEGIYQSLVSGQEVAKTIIDNGYVSEPLRKAIKYNAIQHRILNVLKRSGYFRNLIHEVLLMMMNNKKIKYLIRSSFSPTD